jgi:hypothetical protein
MSLKAARLIAEQPVSAPGPARLELTDWCAQGLVAGITTRADGFNLGFGTAEPANQVAARWRSFLAAFRPQFSGAVLSHQVHGSAVGIHDAASNGLLMLDGLDGHTTQLGGLLLTVTVADCVPVYLAHPKGGAVALLHAGWRGVAAGIVEAGLTRLAARSDVSVAELVMHCGVSICGQCYEVGPEVALAVSGQRVSGPTHIDLRAEIVARAQALGVTMITQSSHCAAHDKNLFFSHRRSGGTDGRMVAYVGRPLP